MSFASYSTIFLVFCSSYSFGFKLNAAKPNENEINLNEIKFVDNYYIQSVESGLVIGALTSEGTRPYLTTMVAIEEAASDPELQTKLLWNMEVTSGIPALTQFLTVGPNRLNHLQVWEMCTVIGCGWPEQQWVLNSRGNSTWGIGFKPWGVPVVVHCLTATGLHQTPHWNALCDRSNESQTWRLVKAE